MGNSESGSSLAEGLRVPVFSAAMESAPLTSEKEEVKEP